MFKKILKIKRSIAYDISYWLDQHLGGHISIGNLTIYGHNAMHWGITYWTRNMVTYVSAYHLHALENGGLYIYTLVRMLLHGPQHL
jgi:hypothetical protein